MASTPQGDAAVSSLIDRALEGARRLVLPVTCSTAARGAADRLSERHGLDVVEVAVVSGSVAVEPATGDLLVHSVPDIFGRLLPSPGTWRMVTVRDRLAHDFTRCEGPVIDVGEEPTVDAALVLGALRSLFKPLVQTRGIRAVFDPPPPLGLPFVAPRGVSIEGEFGDAETVLYPGLPDLVVVRPRGPVPERARRFEPDVVVVR